ncbi:MAG: hypothetical protein ABIP94_11560 [Planctomycetota bacterium]
MLLRVLATLLCLSTVAPCQRAEGQPDGELSRKRQAKQDAGAETKEAQEEWDKLTPEQRLERNVTHGASAHCRFLATVKPAKLMPGQTGVVVVSAILQGDAVLPAPAPLEMVAAPQQGLLSLGSMTILPPAAGKLAKAYLGRPVYDNFAWFEVPITVAPEAEVGKKQIVTIDLRFDLYDGNSAQPVGRFLDRVSTEVEFGRVSDPVVRGFPSSSATSPPSGADEARPDTAAKAPKAPGRVVEGADPLLPERAAAQPAPAQPTTPHATAAREPLPLESGVAIPWPLVLGGGGLVVLILVLLVRKK